MSIRTIEALLRKGLSFIQEWDPEGYAALMRFEGRRLGVALKGLPSFEGLWENNTISLSPLGSKPDLLCASRPSWLLIWALYKAPEAKRHLNLQGDVMFAQALEQAIQSLRIEPADLFSHVLGDKIALPVYTSLSKLFKKLAHQPKAFSESLSDYLCYEKQRIVSGAELSQFYEDVDTLAMDTDRLEAQLTLLRKSLC